MILLSNVYEIFSHITLLKFLEDANYIPSFLVATAQSTQESTQALGIILGFFALIIYPSSRFLEEMAVRVGLPTVLGDLIAGLILGISGFHILMLEGGEINSTFINFISLLTDVKPEILQQSISGSVNTVIELAAEFGVGILLFSIGLESDLKELIKVGFQSAAVAVVGVTLPFILGFFGLVYLFHIPSLPALFAGAALSATSIGITAKVMQDMRVLKSTEGQIILGAAILDDILGIVILAVVISIVETGSIDVGNAVSLLVIAILFVFVALKLR